MESNRRLNRLDLALAAAVLLLMGVYSAVFFDANANPSEDAAMLMRYSQHLAQGHGIAWNIGDKPVDGATDFLTMVCLALVLKTGMPLVLSVRVLLFAAHILTVLVVYFAVRRLHGAGPLAAFVSAAYLAIGPGPRYVIACYGTPFFAMFAAIAWVFAFRLIREEESSRDRTLFALFGLLLGLTRPEGVFLAGFMLAGVVYMKGLRASKRTILTFIAVFGVLGGTYFLWRWHYFGYPLPNPFYKKGGGHLYWSGLALAIRNAAVLCLPFGFAYVLSIRSARTARLAVFSLIPAGCFVAIWLLLSGAMNYLMRFQYAILPIVLISWPPLVQGILGEWNLPRLVHIERRSRAALVALVGFGCVLVLGFQPMVYATSSYIYENNPRDGRYDVALMLREYADRDYTLVTTEAGLLPLYSTWRAVDAWGLNDQWIAHNGIVTEDYLDRYRPQVILFHEYFSPLVPPEHSTKWLEMVLVLKGYAEKNGYTLAACFGETPYETHYYYVRPDFPDSARITEQIRSMDYYWHLSGKKSINYANLAWTR